MRTNKKIQEKVNKCVQNKGLEQNEKCNYFLFNYLVLV